MQETIREYLTDLPMGPAAMLILVLASMFEYVFPPFPGDTVILMGAFLVGAANWDPISVLLTVNLGSLLGIYADYRFGVYVRRHDRSWRERSKLWNRTARAVDQILPLFERHPNYYLVLNRFLPSVRALFFVAAGMADVPLWRVLVFGGASAFCWCLLVFSVGWWLGHDWEALLNFFANYQRVAWLVVVIGMVVLTVWLVRRSNTLES